MPPRSALAWRRARALDRRRSGGVQFVTAALARLGRERRGRNWAMAPTIWRAKTGVAAVVYGMSVTVRWAQSETTAHAGAHVQTLDRQKCSWTWGAQLRFLLAVAVYRSALRAQWVADVGGCHGLISDQDRRARRSCR